MSKFKVKPNMQEDREIEVEADDFKTQNNGNITFYNTSRTTSVNSLGKEIERLSFDNVASFAPGAWKMVTKVPNKVGE